MNPTLICSTIMRAIPSTSYSLFFPAQKIPLLSPPSANSVRAALQRASLDALKLHFHVSMVSPPIRGIKTVAKFSKFIEQLDHILLESIRNQVQLVFRDFHELPCGSGQNPIIVIEDVRNRSDVRRFPVFHHPSLYGQRNSNENRPHILDLHLPRDKENSLKVHDRPRHDFVQEGGDNTAMGHVLPSFMVLAKRNVSTHRIVHVVERQFETYGICRAAGKERMPLEHWKI